MSDQARMKHCSHSVGMADSEGAPVQTQRNDFYVVTVFESKKQKTVH